MGTSWISRKGLNLRKGGLDLEKGGAGGYDPPCLLYYLLALFVQPGYIHHVGVLSINMLCTKINNVATIFANELVITLFVPFGTHGIVV